MANPPNQRHGQSMTTYTQQHTTCSYLFHAPVQNVVHYNFFTRPPPAPAPAPPAPAPAPPAPTPNRNPVPAPAPASTPAQVPAQVPTRAPAPPPANRTLIQHGRRPNPDALDPANASAAGQGQQALPHMRETNPPLRRVLRNLVAIGCMFELYIWVRWGLLLGCEKLLEWLYA